ncbi:ganglioside GM2 activator-like [Sycon ciliatum]|uniref:ganglioside GM2 activator-like n=1 Tax=Sycon ciliatum TaxID=27933 RepID=UPI0020AAA3A3|eukprot:scpid58413/ scgid15335/ Ganglioside GM2 activator; Cerebroside sulfate activator protein; GM2-AP; Shingolipid activator protein 3
MLRQIILIVVLTAVCSSATPFASIEDTLDAFKHLLSLPQQFSRDLESPESPYEFKWDDCSGGEGIAQLKSLSISPDPIPLPGNITASAAVISSASIASPIKASVELYKKVGVWIKIPCIDQIGSCDYDDLCTFLPSGDCPEILKEHNIPCHCPFAAGNYSLPSTSINIQVGSLPSWLANGDYHGKAQLTDSAGKTIACLEAYVSLKVAG